MGLADRNFETIHTNGVDLRCVVEGDGPLIILMHGWPQCWYLWRHQIDPLIEQGWKVCVPDQRGFGKSDCPPEISDYGVLELSADIDGLATALGYDEYALMIHDWGAIVGWNVALLYPDRVRAVVAMSNPYTRHLPPQIFDEKFWGDTFFYIAHFCGNVGGAEAHLDEDVRRSVLQLHCWAGGDHDPRIPEKGRMQILDALPQPPSEMPSWMTNADLDYYTEMYESSGFRGGLNWYRAFPNLLKDTESLEGVKVPQPCVFIQGSNDVVAKMIPNGHLDAQCEDLRGEFFLEGPGHWLPVEAKDNVNSISLDFLAEFV